MRYVFITILLFAACLFGFLFVKNSGEFSPNLSHLIEQTTEPDYESIPLETQVGQLFAIGHWPNIPLEETTRRVHELQLGGVIVMAAPETVTDIQTWTQSWQASSSIPLLISIDQEGGLVSRLRGSEYDQTAQPDIATTEEAYEVAQGRAVELQALGINTNYAPVLDLSVLPDSFMYGRVFRDPDAIAVLGNAMVRGYKDGGVAAVPKHFPGHPDTRDDSHITLPRLDLTIEEYVSHTQPFTDSISDGNIQILMTAHVLVPALDSDFPATVSPIVLRDLRDRIGYGGVILTDDLAMQAISDTWTHEEAAILALQAGADMIMLAAEPEHIDTTVAAVLAAVESGELPRERVWEAYSRVMEVKEEL